MTMEQRMFELLCAYALGETDVAQKIEVERALAASAELREELEKIEATIGLVRESLGGGETLSAEAEKALMSAVNPEPRRNPWYSSGLMRMAASFLVVGGGALWMNMLYERNTANMSAESVAKLRDEEARKAGSNFYHDFGYAGDDKNLVAQLDEKDKGVKDLYGLKVRADGTVVPGEQIQDLSGAGGGGGGGSVVYTGPLPTKPPDMPSPLGKSLPVDPNGVYTWRDTAGIDPKNVVTGSSGDGGQTNSKTDFPNNLNVRLQAGAMIPPLAPGAASVRASAEQAADPVFRFGAQDELNSEGKPEWRGQITPDLTHGVIGPGTEKGNYKGADDTAPESGGSGGHTATKPAPGSPSGAATPTPGMAPRPAEPAASSLAVKSTELGYRKKADHEDSKEQLQNNATAGKAKAEELAKKGDNRVQRASGVSEPGDPDYVRRPGGGGGGKLGSDLMESVEKQAPSRADEAQVRLRRLLERSDSAAVERLARLKEDHPRREGFLKEMGYTGYAGNADRDDEVSLRQLYFKLTPEQRAQILDQECRRVFDGCRRLPNERPRDMFFRYWGDNPFEITALDSLSTFSADVDTASYTLARRYLVEGKLPEKAQIRTEEFVNYFKADVAAPVHGTFAIHTDLAPSRFAQPANSTWTLRVVVRGKELAKEERKPLHLTCVIDCSGSMREQNRIETVKDTLRLLMTQLNSADMVGIVAFSTEARQILPLTSVANRGLIEVAIGQLVPDGWTNSEAGLKLGYETALAGLDANSTNRVVFLSDGVANQGVTDPVQLSESLKPIRERGVYLNTIGVGMNNHNDTLLEQLADKGDGMCSYVDDMREAKRVMMDNFMGSVETIARDVKIQVDFDPAQVARYRLLGYENRAIADADFRNDKIDAGEVGSGHQVTALYEIERNLAVGAERPLATVRLRWKAPRIVNGPANEEATEIAQDVRGSQQTSFEGADAGYRRAVIVGQFAEFLRRSVHARGRSIDELLAEAHKLEALLPQDTDFHEFVALAERSKQLVLANIPNCDELCQAIDAYRTCQFQHAQAERLSHERQQQIVEDLARQNRDMEEKIRELLRRRLESSPR